MIINLDNYKDSLDKSQKLPFLKTKIGSATTNYRFSNTDDAFLDSEGYPVIFPSQGGADVSTGLPFVSSSTGNILNSSSVGTFKIKPAADGNNLYLNSVFASLNRNSIAIGPMSTQGNGTVHIWDRLWVGRCSMVGTADNVYNAPDLTRYTTGEGLSLWFALGYPIYSNIVTTSYQVEYVNQNGENKQSNFTWTFSPTSAATDIILGNNILAIPLGPGDSGIRKLTRFKVLSGGISPSAVNSGVGYIFIAKYYGAFPAQNIGEFPSQNSFLNGFQSIHNEAYLSLAVHLSGWRWQVQTQAVNNRPFLSGEIIIVEG